MNKKRLQLLSKKYLEEAVVARRYLHAHPALGWEEKEASDYIVSILRKNGIECRNDFYGTAVVGMIYGGNPGETVALRADMDALPVMEETGCDYPSEREGLMHACGHDMHMASLLGAALMLNEIKEELHGNVKLIFQPAEEGNTPEDGAEALVRNGILEDVSAIFGTHVQSKFPYGKAGLCEREMMACADVFTLDVHGSGGHISTPHLAHSALYPAVDFINQLSVLRTQSVDPFETVIIDTGYFHCGTADNIIPAEAKIIGNVRAYSDKLRSALKERLENIVKGLEQTYQVNCDFTYEYGYDPLINDPEMSAFLRESCNEVFGVQNVLTPQPSMGAEDFSYYLKKTKGAFVWIGAGDGGAGSQPMHNGKFFPDENVLPLGMETLFHVAYRYLTE